MKLKAIPLLVVLLGSLLLATPQLVAAQDSEGVCDFTLTQVYFQLANAQVAQESGNSDGALAALQEASEQLTSVIAQCSGDASDATVNTPGEGRIVLFSSSYTSSSPLDRLNAFIFVNDINLTIADDVNDFLQELRQPDVVGAIYGGPSSAEVLVALNDLVETGGRVIIMYHSGYMEHNDLLQELFRVALVDEEVLVAEDAFIYPEVILPGWLSGKRIGMAIDDLVMATKVYLVTPIQEGQFGYAASQDTGSERLLYYSNTTGSITFLPLPEYYNDRYFRLIFFADGFFESLDNQEGLLAMVRYLQGGASD